MMIYLLWFWYNRLVYIECWRGEEEYRNISKLSKTRKKDSLSKTSSSSKCKIKIIPSSGTNKNSRSKDKIKGSQFKLKWYSILKDSNLTKRINQFGKTKTIKSIYLRKICSESCSWMKKPQKKNINKGSESFIIVNTVFITGLSKAKDSMRKT